MPTPTGRPRGRPKTKEYSTLMARIPQDLVERVHTYRHLRQMSVSDVLREGLEALLSTDDMLSYRYTDVSDRKGETAQSPVQSKRLVKEHKASTV